MGWEHLSPVRKFAMELIDKEVPEGAEYRSNDPNSKFTRVTDYTQQTLQSNWNSGGIMTACNGFTGWYSRQLAQKFNPKLPSINAFDIPKTLKGAGRSEAWVPSSKSERPREGDILSHQTLHVDVCMGFADGHLLRVGAGQGGKAMGFDRVGRVKGQNAYDPAKLKGWVNIDLLYGAQALTGMEWLIGWWTVTDANTWYYYFAPGGAVQYTKVKPAVTSAPLAADNKGSYTYTNPTLTISWSETTETFRDARPGVSRMTGTSTRYPPLTATRLR